MLYQIVRPYRESDGAWRLPGDEVEIEPDRAAKLRRFGLIGLVATEQVDRETAVVEPVAEKAVAPKTRRRPRAKAKKD